MAGERPMGTFGDYTRSQEGIYDPWAVGISAAMGGFQYGADRRAQQEERHFSEQVRGRQRGEWATDDEINAQLQEISKWEQDQLSGLRPQQAPQQQAGAIPMAADAAPAPRVAPIDPRAYAAQAVPAAMAMPAQPQSPGGTPPAQQPGGGYAPATPLEFRIRAEAAGRRRAAFERDRLRYGDRADAEAANAAAAYGQYIDAGKLRLTRVLDTGDNEGLAAFRKDFPDLARMGRLEGVKLAGPAATVKDANGYPVKAYSFVDEATGNPLPPITGYDIEAMTAELKGDPDAYARGVSFLRQIEREDAERTNMAEASRRGDRQVQIQQGQLMQQALANRIAELGAQGAAADKQVERAMKAHEHVLTKTAQDVDAYLTDEFRVGQDGFIIPTGRKDGQASKYSGITIRSAGAAPVSFTDITERVPMSKSDVVRLATNFRRATADSGMGGVMSVGDATDRALWAATLSRAPAGSKAEMTLPDGTRIRIANSHAGPMLVELPPGDGAVPRQYPLDYEAYSQYWASRPSSGAIPDPGKGK